MRPPLWSLSSLLSSHQDESAQPSIWGWYTGSSQTMMISFQREKQSLFMTLDETTSRNGFSKRLYLIGGPFTTSVTMYFAVIHNWLTSVQSCDYSKGTLHQYTKLHWTAMQTNLWKQVHSMRPSLANDRFILLTAPWLQSDMSFPDAWCFCRAHWTNYPLHYHLQPVRGCPLSYLCSPSLPYLSLLLEPSCIFLYPFQPVSQLMS